MKRSKLQVYDPPMCCSSGVCGPEVDPALITFARDLAWLREQGVEVERYSLSSHPAEFARQECVREALSREGNDCLPLILVDGAIVSRGTYPSRSKVMEFTGMDKEARKELSQDDSFSASALGGRGETVVCGPGCACNVSAQGRGSKLVISLLVLVAVVGILIYKASNAKSSAVNDTATANASAFSVAQPGAEAVPNTVGQPSGGMVAEKAGRSEVAKTPEASDSEYGPPPPPPAPAKPELQTISMVQTEARNRTEAPPAKAATKIGEYLGSLSDLNKVAMSQDAVFVFIPSEKSEAIKGETNDAVLAAQKALKRSEINLGLYTLAAGTAEYARIAKQVQAPAILVACKGKGMAAVSGDVTETKLLQAFMASSRAGGCCPPGSSATCK